MYVRTLRKGLLALAVVWAAAQGAVLTPVSSAAPGVNEGIAFDANTGNYVITYEAEDEIRPKGLYQTIYTPATKLSPTVRSHFGDQGPHRQIVYHYEIKNGRSSGQNLRAFIMAASSADPDLDTPSGWNGSVVSKFGNTGSRAGWSYAGGEELGGLMPGKSLAGFGFTSNDLPGVGLVQFRGATPIQAYAGDGPSQEIADEIEKLDKQNFVVYPAAVPTIVVPTPFDAAVVLDNLRIHITKDIVELRLIERQLAAELDRLLRAAADAARRNSLKAARDHIHDAFKFVQRARPGLEKEGKDDEDGDEDRAENNSRQVSAIDRLAARVIVFNLKYVEKRLKKD